jgi:tripartite-type tricarboxylate transporter receptor subunit TctC
LPPILTIKIIYPASQLTGPWEEEAVAMKPVNVSMHKMGALALIASCVSYAAPAQAQYPSRPVTIVVPFNAGGATDNVARLAAPIFAKALGGNVVVKNSTGAAGTIGAAEVASARPDGHTIGMLAIGPVTTQPHLRKLVYGADSFIPICMLNRSPVVATVPKTSPYKTLDDLKRAAEAKPNSLVYGSPGPGSIPHIAAFALAKALGVQMKHIPHSGGAEVAKSMMGGVVQLLVDVSSNVTLFDLHPLAVAHTERLPELPSVPTMKELGYDLEFAIWFGVFAPKETPSEVVAKLDNACEAAGKSAEFAASMNKFKSSVSYMPRKEFTAFVKADYQKNGKVLEEAGLKK